MHREVDQLSLQIRKTIGAGGRWLQFEPEERVRSECDGVGRIGDGGERNIAEHLYGLGAGVVCEIERCGLGKTAEVGHAEDGFVRAVAAIQIAQIGQDFAVGWVEKFERAAAEDMKE